MPIVATASASRWVDAALTVQTFYTGYTLVTGTNYGGPGVPTASTLIDITHTESTTGTIGAAVTSSSGSLSLTAGAIAVNFAVPSAGFNIDASSTGTSVGTTSITLAGGNTGTVAPLTASGDLITLTSTVAGTVTFRGNYGGITLNLPSTGGNFDVAGGSTLQFSSGTTLTGSGAITVTGGGTVSITSAQSSFTGGFTLAAGTLNITNSSSLTLGTGDSTTLAGGEINTTVSGLVLGTTHPLVLSNGGGTFAVNTGTASIAGTLSGTGTLVKAGAGTLLLNTTANVGSSAAVTFIGGVSINQGTLLFDAAGDLGNSSNTITLNGGTLAYTGYQGVSTTFNNATLVSTRTLVLNSVTSDIDVGLVGTGSISTLTVNCSVNGSGSLVKTGVGTLVLAGTSTFAGSQTVAGGTLSIADATQLGVAPTTPTDNIILSGGALELTDNTTTTPFNVNRSVVLGTAAAAGTGTIGVAGAHTAVFAGLFHDAAGGAGTLAKVDTGTLVLNSGSSTYTGGTKVLNGLLLVNNTTGSATGTGSITVGDGAANAGSFGGNGIVTSDVNVSSTGTLTPGTFGGTSIATYGLGTLTVDSHNVMLASGSTFIVKLGASGNDQLAVIGGGNIILGDGSTASTLNLSVVDSGAGSSLTPGKQYVIATASGNVTNFSNLTATITSPTYAAGEFTLGVDSPGDPTELILTVAPEPASGSAVLIGAASLLGRRRRRSTSVPA